MNQQEKYPGQRSSDVAHSAVGHSQSPGPLPGTCFQTNLEDPTAHGVYNPTVTQDVLFRPVLACSAQQRCYEIMRYINPHFTYLHTYLGGGVA